MDRWIHPQGVRIGFEVKVWMFWIQSMYIVQKTIDVITYTWPNRSKTVLLKDYPADSVVLVQHSSYTTLFIIKVWNSV